MEDVKINTNIKKEANNTLISILLFVLVYILTISTAIGIACFFVYIGLNIIARTDIFFFILVGIGVAGIGVMIILNILNFIFPKSPKDHPTMTEITAKEEPELFKLIEKIAEQTYAPLPRKVFLSHDVYAAVFSRSNIIDLFINRRKNLIIGIGLINMISERELEALLGHEFGHTTQKSNRVGVLFSRIQNLVSEMINQDYEFKKDIDKISNNNFIGLFTQIGNKINDNMRDLLVKVYHSLLKNFNSLSREMEYQADEISSKIAGYKANESLLVKFDLASESLVSVINFYHFSPNPISSENIYENQKHVMFKIAERLKLQTKNNMPIVDITTLDKIQITKISLGNQWSTHPSLEDRLQWMKQNANEIDNNFKPASDYFSNFSNTQKSFTKLVFEKLFEFDEEVPVLTKDEFQTEFDHDLEIRSYPKIFNAYYDDLFKLSLHKDDNNFGNSIATVQELFNDKNTRIRTEYVILLGDIFTIENLDKSIKSIDYDGKKYINESFDTLLAQLRKKSSDLEKQIGLNDFNILETAINLEKKQNLPPHIKEYCDLANKMEKDISVLSQALYDTRKSYQFLEEKTEIDIIKSHLKQGRAEENKLKDLIRNFLNNKDYHAFIEESTREELMQYTTSDLGYFHKKAYIDTNIEKLSTALSSINILIETLPSSIKKYVLNYLAELFEGAEN